jgi:hypothetical protein
MHVQVENLDARAVAALHFKLDFSLIDQRVA